MSSFTTVIYPTYDSPREFMMGELDSRGMVRQFVPLVLRSRIGTGDPNMFYLVMINDKNGEMDVAILDKYKAFATRTLWIEESIDTLSESGTIDPVNIANLMLTQWKAGRSTRFH